MILARLARESLASQAALFVVLIVCYAYFVQPPGANALSRYNLVRAIVDDRSLIIDRYQHNTVDKGYFRGHYYSDKAFGLSLLAAPAYALLRAANVVEAGRDDQRAVYLLTLLVVALPAAALAVLVARLARHFGFGAAEANGAALAYGLGTMALPYATMFFGHQTSAFFSFSSAYLILALRGGKWARSSALRRSIAAGFLAGIAALVEYPAAIVGIALFGYLLLSLRQRSAAVAFAAGILPATVALASYNYVAFGDFLSVSYEFVRDPRFAGAQTGLLGVTAPDPSVLLQLLFSGRGLIVNSPVTLLAVLGLWRLWRARLTRPEALFFSSVFALFLVYNAGYYLPFGGWTPGPRFLLPALPFLMLPVAAAIGRSRRSRAAFLVLLCYSIFVMGAVTVTTPTAPEAKCFPLFDVWLPNLLRGDLAYNLGRWYFGLRGLFSLLPLALSLFAVLYLVGPRGWSGHYVRAAVPAILAICVFILPALVPLEEAALPASGDEVALALVSVRPAAGPGDVEEVMVHVRNGPVPVYNGAVWLAARDGEGAVRAEDWLSPISLEPGESRHVPLRLELPAESKGEVHLTASFLHWSWAAVLGQSRPMTAAEVILRDESK